MPAEAIHLSAFLDSLALSGAPAQFSRERGRALGRLGAVVIDFPYFERFPLGVLRYLFKQPTARSAWGDALHHTTPVAIAHALLENVRALRRAKHTQAAAEDVLALALGFVSHLAVDRSLHPLVNQLARERAAQLGGDAAHHHTEVEKFQSVLFHEERNGFDFMGRRELADHISVDVHVVHREPHLFEALTAGFLRALRKAPRRQDLQAWAKGYGQFVSLVSSPVGKLLVPERIKPQVRSEVYGGSWGTFTARYEEAVQRSREAIDAALALAEDPAQVVHFERVLPEGAIDF